MHGVDSHERVKVRKQLKRSQMLDFFRQVESPCVVAMEACGSAHYWGRELIKLGHEVRLISPQFVKPYVKSGKNDAMMPKPFVRLRVGRRCGLLR